MVISFWFRQSLVLVAATAGPERPSSGARMSYYFCMDGQLCLKKICSYYTNIIVNHMHDAQRSGICEGNLLSVGPGTNPHLKIYG